MNQTYTQRNQCDHKSGNPLLKLWLAGPELHFGQVLFQREVKRFQVEFVPSLRGNKEVIVSRMESVSVSPQNPR